MKTFLDAYTLRVVTLLVQSHAPGDAIAAAFRDAGLDGYAYAHDGGATWPTLGTMVAKGTRLVTFVRFTPDPSGAAADGGKEVSDAGALTMGAPFLEPWIDGSARPTRGPLPSARSTAAP